MAEVAVLCGVLHLLDRRPETLSGGERQRVGLARSLAPRPRLLLCDEPVSALDLPNRQVLLDRLRAVQQSEGIPVLYVTHSPAEAIGLGSRLFLLERGTIIADGPPLDLLSTISNPSLTHLEGLCNNLHVRVEEQIPNHGAMRLAIQGGPALVVPLVTYDLGTAVTVELRAEDILLARGPISGSSAQNLIEGEVERVVLHGAEAEVLIRTGDVTWIASVVAPAIDQLGLAPGQKTHMIIKAAKLPRAAGDHLAGRPATARKSPVVFA